MRLIPSDPDIETIVGRIADGSLDLQPDFQRGSVWTLPKQRLLVDSVVRNWYVPPVHVVRTPDDEQVVLDGQQRLRAIWEFVQGQFPVDGMAEPLSDEIQALDGLRYFELPAQVKRRFDRFTLRIFEVVDYETQEPYELFFRLNQPTTLTSAEKRNAFFGVPREQVKVMTEVARDAGMVPERIGFSNARMAYEDVVARFLWTLEVGSLGERVTANRVTDRYRSDLPFDREVLEWARESIGRLFACASLDQPSVRLNKATAHTWLCFVARGVRLNDPHDRLEPFVADVETSRAVAKRSVPPGGPLGRYARLLELLNDRATSRVNDASSVLLRDLILWILYTREYSDVATPAMRGVVRGADTAIGSNDPETALLAAADRAEWGSLP